MFGETSEQLLGRRASPDGVRIPRRCELVRPGAIPLAVSFARRNGTSDEIDKLMRFFVRSSGSSTGWMWRPGRSLDDWTAEPGRSCNLTLAGTKPDPTARNHPGSPRPNRNGGAAECGEGRPACLTQEYP